MKIAINADFGDLSSKPDVQQTVDHELFIMDDKTSTVELTLRESGTLCHVLMRQMLQSGGVDNQPEWIIALYEKLAAANDKLMHPED